MENENKENNENYNSLKFKRKRDQFTYRLDSLMALPKTVQSKFTHATFVQDLSVPILLKKIHTLSPTNRNNFNSSIDVQQEVSTLKNEIDEIVYELEFFNRTNRQKRQIKMMEKIAEYINEDLIDIDELLEYKLLGNKICNIENEYLENLKKKKVVVKDDDEDDENVFLRYDNLKALQLHSNCNSQLVLNTTDCTTNKKFSEYTNRLLMDDDEVFVNRKSSTEEKDSLTIHVKERDREREIFSNNSHSSQSHLQSQSFAHSQTNSCNKIFKIHQINK
jgi:hypothetical protein